VDERLLHRFGLRERGEVQAVTEAPSRYGDPAVRRSPPLQGFQDGLAGIPVVGKGGSMKNDRGAAVAALQNNRRERGGSDAIFQGFP
jgi:hypothetical protein